MKNVALVDPFNDEVMARILADVKAAPDRDERQDDEDEMEGDLGRPDRFEGE